MRTRPPMRLASAAPSSSTPPPPLLLLCAAAAAAVAFSAIPTAAASGGGGAPYTRTWAVRLDRGLPPDAADRVAAEEGFINVGKILELDTGDVYLFEHPRLTKRSLRPNVDSHARLVRRSEVLWAEQQIAKRRVKRDLQFNDPLWPETWYLDRGARGGFDMNVKAAWSKGVTGRGVVLTVLDDGLEWQHPDLQANYDPDASIDLNNISSGGLDRDPTPRYDWTNENRHGTRCAGEIAAAANNNVCSVGVAYNARIGGVRMLDGDVTDSVEAQSLSLNPQHVDIYSASWGPDDNGRTVDGPGPLARAAFLNGITKGRDGKGSLFVWASGNGGSHGDSCACDGYSNNPFTLSVSSVTQSNARPWYLEECASTLATTYSSGSNGGRDRQVVTTDLRQGCTEQHTGTSASAPLAAAMVALVLEANPRLTWRDMQYIVLMTANPKPLSDGNWITNGAGRQVSHLYGYGLMDAGAMVDLARNWTGAPDRKTWQSDIASEQIKIGDGIKRFITVPACRPGNASCVRYLEHVQLIVSVESSRRGALRIVLHSPSGTASTLLPSRRDDSDAGDFNDWSFTSVHFWGEQPVGQWLVEVFNGGATGVLESYQLVLWGTSEDPLVQCHAECRRPCSGPGSDQCRDCANYRLGVDGPCVAQCPERSGYYTDALHRMCSPCPVDGCLACDSTRPTTCDVCSAGLLLDASHEDCIQHCLVGTWPDQNGTQCIPCSQAHCMSCTNGSNCDLCADEYEWTPSAGACASICAPDTYREAGPAARCLPCSEDCATCTGPLSSQCSSCVAGLHLFEQACVADCPAATYANNEDQQCLPCHNSCKTCNGPLDNNCLSCVNDSSAASSSAAVVLTLYNQCLVLEACSPGHFRHANGSCMSCHPSCRACSGPFAMDCSSCSATATGNRYLGRLGCVEACDDDEYAGNDGACHPCPRPCVRCMAGSGPDHCASCATGWMLEEASCTSSCSAGYYAASSKAECAKCHPSCSLCFGPGSGDCAACPSDRVLDAGSCVTSCGAWAYLHQPPPDPSAGSSRADHNSSNTKECLPCHHSCASCSGPGSQECTSCDDALVLKKGQCIDKPMCHVGQFYEDQLQECMSCHKSCLSCIGPSSSQCTACPSLHWRDVTASALAAPTVDEAEPNSTAAFACRPCCGRNGLPLPAAEPLASHANSTACCPCASDPAAVEAFVDSGIGDPDCMPATTTVSTALWTTTSRTSSSVSHYALLLHTPASPGTVPTATSSSAATVVTTATTAAAAAATAATAAVATATTAAAAATAATAAVATEATATVATAATTASATAATAAVATAATTASATAATAAVATAATATVATAATAASATSDGADSTPAASHMPTSSTLDPALTDRSTWPTTGAGIGSTGGRTTPPSANAGAGTTTDGVIAITGGAAAPPPTGTSSLAVTTGSLSSTAGVASSDHGTSPDETADKGKDVLQLEREMSLLSALAAVVGAVTLTSCAVYGAALVVLYARRRGLCAALLGARCTNGGVVYVQVDTSGDGDTVTTSASTAIQLDEEDDFEHDTCDEDDYDNRCDGKQSMPGLTRTCGSVASLTALDGKGWRGARNGGGSSLETRSLPPASSVRSLIDLVASSASAYENCQCEIVAAAADAATPVADVTSVVIPATVAAVATAATGAASRESRASMEIKDL